MTPHEFLLQLLENWFTASAEPTAFIEIYGNHMAELDGRWDLNHLALSIWSALKERASA